MVVEPNTHRQKASGDTYIDPIEEIICSAEDLHQPMGEPCSNRQYLNKKESHQEGRGALSEGRTTSICRLHWKSRWHITMSPSKQDNGEGQDASLKKEMMWCETLAGGREVTIEVLQSCKREREREAYSPIKVILRAHICGLLIYGLNTSTRVIHAFIEIHIIINYIYIYLYIFDA